MLTEDRLRMLQETPYTQKEAEAAAGLGTDNGKRQTMKPTDPERDASAMDIAPA